MPSSVCPVLTSPLPWTPSAAPDLEVLSGVPRLHPGVGEGLQASVQPPHGPQSPLPKVLHAGRHCGPDAGGATLNPWPPSLPSFGDQCPCGTVLPSLPQMPKYVFLSTTERSWTFQNSSLLNRVSQVTLSDNPPPSFSALKLEIY